MLAEFLEDRGDWTQVMPGVRTCLFAVEEGPFPCHLPLRLEPLHFEALFCQAGSVTLTRRDGSALTAGTRQILLLSDSSSLADARIHAPLAGVLVTVDARKASDSLKTLCALLGKRSLNTGRVRNWMTSRGGCAVEGPGDWSRAVFANLDRLPQSEQTRWCVWKSAELLYLFSAPEEPAEDVSLAMDREAARRIAGIRQYMEEHLDEPLTISALSRRACLSATAFKSGFRRLYSLPVHTWLRQRRMEKAAELLRGSSLSVLEVAMAVGYGSASQFTAAFRLQYGVTPAAYRKNV